MSSVEPFIGPLSPSYMSDEWYGYRYKDAWWDFDRAHPDTADHIRVCIARHREESPDPILASNLWYEAKCLRVAWLLGMVEFDWEERPPS